MRVIYHNYIQKINEERIKRESKLIDEMLSRGSSEEKDYEHNRK